MLAGVAGHRLRRRIRVLQEATPERVLSDACAAARSRAGLSRCTCGSGRSMPGSPRSRWHWARSGRSRRRRMARTTSPTCSTRRGRPRSTDSSRSCPIRGTRAATATFGLTGFAVAILAWLSRRTSEVPGWVSPLGLILGLFLVLTWLARMIVLDSTSMLVLGPALVSGLLSPVFFLGLGAWLLGWRGGRAARARSVARSPMTRISPSNSQPTPCRKTPTRAMAAIADP